jgi:segregation and condensation protein B
MALENDQDLYSAVEAILMVADQPLSLSALAAALDRPVAEVRAVLTHLRDEYDGKLSAEAIAAGAVARERGYELREVGGGFRLYVRENFDWAVRLFLENDNPTKLSQAALETLAVIAYKQPISRGQVASIRAVNVDSVVRTLLSRGLISELYTDSESGAIHYGTSPLLLEKLGINSLDELPLISPFLPDAMSDFNVEL